MGVDFYELTYMSSIRRRIQFNPEIAAKCLLLDHSIRSRQCIRRNVRPAPLCVLWVDHNSRFVGYSTAGSRPWSTLWRLLRVGPVSWLQDLHSIPAVHPAWRNVNSVCGRFYRFEDWCRLKLLNNDDLLFADSARTQKSKPMETVCKGMLPVHLRSSQAPRSAERASRAKNEAG